MELKNGQKMVMIGDSITDAGRRDLARPYGNGYMAQVRTAVMRRYPDLEIVWENRGVGGDTVRHLAARWHKDVIAENPDVLTVMIGINDVWRRFGDRPLEAVPADEYVSILVTLLRRTRAETGAEIIVASPYMIEADRGDPMRAAMDLYGGLARQVADEVDADFVDLQAAFDRVLQTSASADWTDDRVDKIHLNAEGHRVITNGFLKALGIEASGES